MNYNKYQIKLITNNTEDNHTILIIERRKHLTSSSLVLMTINKKHTNNKYSYLMLK
jgi:hypothetical protein